MRIAVIGDTHLGRTLYGYDLTPSIRGTMYSFFRFCQEQKVDVAVHLGDLFDSPRPTLVLEKVAIQWANEFERAGIDLHLLVGNHDVIAKGGISSALAPLKAIRYQHVMVHERPQCVRTPSKQLDLMFIPFPSPALYSSASERLSGIYDALGQVRGTAVVFSHLNVVGATMGEQDWVYRGGDYSLPSELAHDEKVALVVSGHIHKQQWLPGRHLVLGSSQRLRFGEHEDPCNFLLLDDPEGKDGCTFHETGRGADEIPHQLEMVVWEADASAWGNDNVAPSDEMDLWQDAPVIESSSIVKLQPFVDEHSCIDWRKMEELLYGAGAAFVKVMSPIFVTRKEKQRPSAAVVGEPVRAAAHFIKARIKEPSERKAVMRIFRRLQEAVDAD